MIYKSYNEFHIGDNLVHLNFLRKLGKQNPQHQFIHYAHKCHIDQLEAITEDTQNVWLRDLDHLENRDGVMNSWKNAGAGTPTGGFWERHRLRNDFSGFYLDWFNHLSTIMGLECPMKTVDDLLFDYPKILDKTQLSAPFDILFINSRPCSGQFRAYDRLDYFDPLIEALMNVGHRIIVTQKSELPVPCTQDQGLTITGIGNLSLYCKYIIMVSTGPSWATFNVWNKDNIQLRVVCLTPEMLNLSRNTVHVGMVEEITPILQHHKLL